jgi:hypothetical protein
MDLFFWRKTKAIDAFARAVADGLYSHVQPDAAKAFLNGEAKTKAKKHHQVERHLAGVIDEFRRFTRAQALGIYGKARLQQQFSERLRELGYEPAVTKRLVEIMLLANP